MRRVLREPLVTRPVPLVRLIRPLVAWGFLDTGQTGICSELRFAPWGERVENFGGSVLQ